MNEDENLIAELKQQDEYTAPDDENVPKDAEEEQDEAEDVEDADDDTDSDEESDEESEEGDEESEEENKIDGQKVTVKTADGDIKLTVGELKQGYMRQSDYTQKIQEAAEIRKNHYEGAKNFAELVSYISDNIDKSIFMTEEKHLEDQLSKINPRELSPDDFSLYQQNVAYLNQLKKDNEERFKGLEELKKVQEQKNKDFLEALKREESKKLERAIPEYSDPIKRKEVQSTISNYLNVLYGDDAKKVASSVTDHRDIILMRDAALGYEFRTKKLPKKDVIKQKVIRNDIKRTALSEQGQTSAKKTLRQIKSRGSRAAATQGEINTFLESQF